VAQIDEWLIYLKERGGSDLHLAAGMEPRIRVHGDLRPIDGSRPLDDAGLRKLLNELPTEVQWKTYEKSCDLDFAYGLDGTARFRANYFVQENGAGAVFRMIPDDIVPLEKLNLPPAIEKLAHLAKGLALVTGPTGSGKSTTLAAIIDKINRTYRRHIVTIEDPVEFVHQNRESLFSHREVGAHTNGFGAALRAAIRQDADVILVGEMRDYETISLAITAAEMGLLVFGTLHTNNAAKTIDRIINAFPSEEHAKARTSLSRRQGPLRGERDPAQDVRPPAGDPRGQHLHAQLDHPVGQGAGYAVDGRRPLRPRQRGAHPRPGRLPARHRQGAFRAPRPGRLIEPLPPVLPLVFRVRSSAAFSVSMRAAGKARERRIPSWYSK
jgi:twitching motility protein PilT